MTTPWYMAAPMRNLLAAIRQHESGRADYNADYQNDDRWLLTNKSFDTVRALGRSQVVPQNERSSAIGAYQFLTKTMDSLKASLKLTGQEIMTPAFQDDLAVALMVRRGFMRYMRGEIGDVEFANNLAKEWASLPVVSTIIGARGHVLAPGQSYYAGDGLNKAFHTPDRIMSLVGALRTMKMDGNVQPPEPAPADDDVPSVQLWPLVGFGLIVGAFAAAKAFGLI